MKYIQLHTELPGPNSKALLARRAAAMPAGWAKSTDIGVASASGALIVDVDGNTLIDFAGGIGTINAGHCQPTVLAAATQQMQKFIHTCNLVTTNEPSVQLCEMLNQLTPGDFEKKTMLANSGAESVENAVNIAKYYTKRPIIVVFEGGYHGRTMLTVSMTSKYGLFKKGYGASAADIVRLPVPNMYRVPDGMTENQYLHYCLQQLDNMLIAQADPSAIAAIVIEPVQGEGGFVPIPKPYLQKIRSICDTYGIVMIADEIQSGFGRTGKLFAMEHYGIAADMTVTAKSLGSGFPIGAVVGRKDIMDTPHLGAVGSTYGGNPVASAAAIETIKILTNPDLQAHSVRIGERMEAIMQTWKEKYRIIGDVRGLGPMRLVEFVKDRTTREPDPDLTLTIIKDAVSKGIVLIRAGLYSNCIRLLPPLVITEAQLTEGMEVLEGAIARANAQ